MEKVGSLIRGHGHAHRSCQKLVSFGSGHESFFFLDVIVFMRLANRRHSACICESGHPYSVRLMRLKVGRIAAPGFRVVYIPHRPLLLSPSYIQLHASLPYTPSFSSTIRRKYFLSPPSTHSSRISSFTTANRYTSWCLHLLKTHTWSRVVTKIVDHD